MSDAKATVFQETRLGMFDFRDRAPMQRIADPGFDAATIKALLHGNAERYLALEGKSK